ncbi:MAG: ABC transporter permease [Actinomycetota bacterium]|nr:ABC transporter permease [Actinomycetota bacterium]
MQAAAAQGAVGTRAPEARATARRPRALTKSGDPLVWKWVVRLGAIVAFFVAWQIYAGHVNPILLVSPTAIARTFGHMVADGTLPTATLQSLEVLVIGFGAALVAGIVLGLVWARYKVVDWAIQPFVSAIFSTPLIALVPLYVLWFGFGVSAKIAIVGSFSFFPILLNTYQGAVSVDPTYRDTARAFHATERQMWRHVTIPSCIPFIAAGINVSLGHALTGLIIAEFYTNASGLGGIVLKSADTFETARMFVPIVTVMVLGILLMSATRWLKRAVAPWAER